MGSVRKTVATGSALAAVALVGACLGPMARPAEAAYPGRNGKIVFTSNRVTADNPDGDFEIFTMNGDGDGIVQLTKNDQDDVTPVWSPNGKRLAFGRFGPGDTVEIWVMDADGQNQRQLTQFDAFSYSPTWSPNGNNIAFASDADGDFEIYVMDADGGDTQQLTHNDAVDDLPSWSPRSKTIAFNNDRDDPGDVQIYKVKANGGKAKPLTSD
ncbi:MAG TPA: DPP IV N-terminal domain-containing protein, partial [Thermomicrobiales bacterium]|nr:DPP IV N-terminal domain-containing protein [Thermomicrobiales bacterium]